METGWIESVNSDPHINLVTAMDAGLTPPRVRILKSNSEIEEVMRDPAWGIVSGMAVEKIVGPEVTYHALYRRGEFSCRTISINDTELLTDGHGPDIGDNATTIFTGMSKPRPGEDVGPIEPCLDRLAELAIRHEGEYEGFISVRVTYQDGIPYYQGLEYGASMKLIDGIITLYDADISTFFNDESRELRLSMIEGYAATLRLYAYPYDIERNKKVCEGIPGLIWDESCGSWIALGRGRTIKDTWREMYAGLKPYVSRGVCYRTDGEIKPRRVYSEIMRRQLVTRDLTLCTESIP